MTSQPTVLITGGNGELGRVLVQGLPAWGWRVRVLDIEAPSDQSVEYVVGTVTDADTVRASCEGVDAVVHMAGISQVDSDWHPCLDVNIGGTRTLLEGARMCGVGRVVIASSNHAAGYIAKSGDPLAATAGPRPDSWYGVSKAAMELLGSYYADKFALQTVSLRIGSCLPAPTDERSLSTWLSHPDLVRLVRATLEGPWTGHTTIWGISRNTRRWWSLEEGELMGYHPQDDAERFADLVSSGDSNYVGGSAPAFVKGTQS